MLGLLSQEKTEVDNDDPNIAWEALNTKFTEVAEKLCPKREYKMKKDRPLYITSEISIKRFTTESVNCKFKWEFRITEDEVLKEVSSLSNLKSSGIVTEL